MRDLLYRAIAAVLGVLLANISYLVYAGLRNDARLDSFWGISRDGNLVKLVSPMTFCDVEETWTRKPVNGTNCWRVTASFTPEDNCVYMLENESPGLPPGKLTVCVQTGGNRIELYCAKPNEECDWQEISLVVKQENGQHTYTAHGGNLIFDQINLPSR